MRKLCPVYGIFASDREFIPVHAALPYGHEANFEQGRVFALHEDGSPPKDFFECIQGRSAYPIDKIGFYLVDVDGDTGFE